MNTFSNSHIHDPTINDDVYNFDEGAPKSPVFQARKVNTAPSPTPSLELPATAESPPSPRLEQQGRKHPRSSNKANLGDAVLVSYLADGTRPDIANLAGKSPLASAASEDETQTQTSLESGSSSPTDPTGPKSGLVSRNLDRGGRGVSSPGRVSGGPPDQNRPHPELRRSMSIDPPAETASEREPEPTARAAPLPVSLAGGLLGSLQSLATSALAFGGHRAEISDNTSRAPTSLDIRCDGESSNAPLPLQATAATPRLAQTPHSGALQSLQPSLASDGPFRSRERDWERERERERERDGDYDMERDDRSPAVHPGVPSPYSPRSSAYSHSPLQPSLSPMHSMSLRSPTSLPRTVGGELPPIHMQAMASPRSETNSGHGHNPLPSIKDLDLSFNQAAPSPDGRHNPASSSFAHSPPPGLPRISAISHHNSPPPMSPNDAFSRRGDMPSPAMHLSPAASSPYYPHHPPPAPPAPSLHANGYPNNLHHSRHSVDYSSSSATETPGSTGGASDLVGAASPSNSILSPASATGAVGADQQQQHAQPGGGGGGGGGGRTMSIDGLTTTMGAYVCQFPGCTALPFQTQYLLNSHANVHSSERPHYCPVKGCPRSEGGKGFKRKNEMIRHGLVHDSPGYVCPFCPDREHKYPRPDNLQRHVRVHHVDKDKDDAQLRDVLAQRPDGPNRGRRRRHGPS